MGRYRSEQQVVSGIAVERSSESRVLLIIEGIGELEMATDEALKLAKLLRDVVKDA